MLKNFILEQLPELIIEPDHFSRKQFKKWLLDNSSVLSSFKNSPLDNCCFESFSRNICKQSYVCADFHMEKCHLSSCIPFPTSPCQTCNYHKSLCDNLFHFPINSCSSQSEAANTSTIHLKVHCFNLTICIVT